MKKLIIIFLLLNTFAIGQSVKITEIRKITSAWNYASMDTSIVYPVINTNSKSINKKINEQILEVFVDTEYLKKPVDVALDSAISGGLFSMSYEVTFNSNNILSITINAVGCGAYCSGWSTYFNFNTSTGKSITIDDILINEKKTNFGNMVRNEKTKNLIEYKKVLKEQLEKTSIDSSAYEWALEQVNEYCMNSVSVNQFSLTASEIEIHDDCDFPHAIQGLQPDYKLEYPYADITEMLKPDWKKILMK